MATTTLVLVGLYLILALEAEGRGRSSAVGLLVLTLLAGYVAALMVPFARDFFLLAPPSVAVVLPAVAGALLAVLGLAALGPRFVPGLGGEHAQESVAAP